MATLRENPYIWATWLARAMTGDCMWQAWFQTHNQLTEKQPTSFDLVGWKVDHTRMVEELRKQLATDGLKLILSQRVRLDVPSLRTVVSGEVDGLVATDGVTVYECKTGQERDTDQTQLMIYMYLVSQWSRFQGKAVHGVLVYKKSRFEIPRLPDSFSSNFDYFVGLLASDDPVSKAPGNSCGICPITIADCADREQI